MHISDINLIEILAVYLEYQPRNSLFSYNVTNRQMMLMKMSPKFKLTSDPYVYDLTKFESSSNTDIN